MAEDDWQQSRLIPTSGISGSDEAERRATSALLAVMASVREFGLSVVKPLGASAAQLDTFIEVPFQVGERTVIPDGVLQSVRAGKTWTALVEVKTGSGVLEKPQVEDYLDVARENGFQAVLTISNQMAPAPGVHPVDVDRRKLKKVALEHISWAEVLTVAVQQRVHRGVSDPDQAWILGELIRYLEHPKSGALDFSDMGASWVAVRDAVATGTLRANDKGLSDVVSHWEQLLRFAALRLGRELGAAAQVQLSRKEAADPALRFTAQAESLVASGVLFGSLKIPDAVAPIDIVADLRSSRITVTVDIDAPRDGRAATRVNWLIRQLRDAPDGLRIDAFATGSRSSTSELLKDVRINPGLLVQDPKRDLRSFRITAASPMGTKRGTGRGCFIDSLLASIDGFYGAVIQQLRPWTAKAPQLPRGTKTATEDAGINIDPPAKDLLEETPTPMTAPLAEKAVADLVTNGDAAAADVQRGPDTASERGADAPDVFVSWDDAQDRIEHERSVVDPGSSPGTAR